MFKKILAAFVGSLAAIWISAIVMLVIFFAFIGSLVSSDPATVVQKHSILHLDLSGVIDEYQSHMSVQQLVQANGEMPSRLDQYLEAVDIAAHDPYVDCIYLDCDNSELGMAGRQELVEALLRFRKAGKKVYAYADVYSQGDYYVATAADRLTVNPSGMVDVHGLGVAIPFFKSALDKLGITVQVFKVGRFKSAVEPYLLTEPSEPSRLQTMEYIDAIWKSMSATIAANRKVSPAKVTAWADSLIMTVGTKELVAQKVVDATLYRRQMEDELRKASSVSADDDLRLVTPAEYLDSDPRARAIAFENKVNDKLTGEGYFAVLYAVGDIVDSGNDGIVGPKMVSEILDLANDKDVKGLVLRVNSPGGSAFASEQIWEALQYFKSKKKPFYVSMSDYAASGGYYISCGADRIYADANTITGSIGIFGMMPCMKGLLTDKLGINIATIGNTPNATFPSITQPMTPAQAAAMQRHVEQGYDLFTSRVAAGRHMSQDSVKQIAEGRVYAGAQALRLGLVDKLGGVDMAIRDMAATLKMNPDNYASFPDVQMSPLMAILAQSDLSSSAVTGVYSGGAHNPDITLAGDIRSLASAYASATAIPGVDVASLRARLKVLLDARRQGFVQARMAPVTIE